MELFLYLLIICLVACVSGAPADSMITQAPDFIGWIRQGTGYEVAICEKGILTSSRYWAACIDTDQPALPTRCRDGSVLIFPTTTAICPTTATCRTDWFFNDPADTAARTMIGCVTDTRTLYYYRTTVVATTESTVPGTSSEPTSTSSVAPVPSTAEPAPNLAWIAGPIVGGFVGIALLILLVWFLMRRKNNHTNHRASMVVETPDSEAKPEITPVITTLRSSLKRNPTRRAELPDRPSSLRSVP